MRVRSIGSKMHFWMIQSVKKEVFGHFLDLGLLDWLGIAYYDKTRCVSTFGNTTRSWGVIQKSPESIFECCEVPKMRLLAIILSLVCWIDLILHMMIEFYVFHHSATLPGHEGSFKSLKKYYWMIQSAKKWVFDHFHDLGLLDRRDIAYYGRIVCFPTFGNTTRSWRIIQKSLKCSFEWSQVPKNVFLVVFLT